MPESKDARSELLQGTLDLLILRTLAAGPMHGWGISQRIQQVSDSVLVVNQGSLYPALYRLEEEGWIASEWGASENNRRAKFYKLTRAGRAPARPRGSRTGSASRPPCSACWRPRSHGPRTQALVPPAVAAQPPPARGRARRRAAPAPGAGDREEPKPRHEPRRGAPRGAHQPGRRRSDEGGGAATPGARAPSRACGRTSATGCAACARRRPSRRPWC